MQLRQAIRVPNLQFRTLQRFCPIWPQWGTPNTIPNDVIDLKNCFEHATYVTRVDDEFWQLYVLVTTRYFSITVWQMTQPIVMGNCDEDWEQLVFVDFTTDHDAFVKEFVFAMDYFMGFVTSHVI